MKKNNISLLLTALFFATSFVSCQKEEDFSTASNHEEEFVNQTVDYHISADEAIDLTYRYFGLQKTKSAKDDIRNLRHSGETVAYIVSLGDKGWAMVSSDKRTQSILAFNETEKYNPEKVSEGQRFWMDGMCNSLYALRHDSLALKNSRKLRKWTNASAIAAQKELVKTKGGDDPHINDWLQLVYTVREPVEVRNVGHLIETKWGQGSPWNAYTPYCTDTLVHSNAGCCAVALAQLCYFMHYKANKPLYSPAQCDASGTTNNYSVTYSNFSSATWDSMPKSVSEISYTKPLQAAAALITYIGTKMAYGNHNKQWLTLEEPHSWSSATEGYMTDFLNYDEEMIPHISFTSFTSFNPATVASNIANGYPVLASSYITSGSLWSGYTRVGHAWLVDGVVQIDTYDTYYSQWMPIGTYPPVMPEEPDYDHPENYVISDPVLVDSDYYFMMNWGYGGEGDNTMYYYGSAWNVDRIDFSQNARMLYNIH